MQASPEVQELLLRINASTALLERELKKGADAIDNLGNKAEGTAARYDRSMRRVDEATKRSQFAMRNLGFQIQDIGTSLASGSSPFVVLAQQGGQVAGAVSEMGGVLGRVGAFLTGPFGATLLTVGTLLGSLWFNSRRAAEGASEHDKAARAQTSAMEALDDILKSSNQKMREQIDLGKKGAEQARENAQEALKEARAQLALAQARAANTAGAGRITAGNRGDGVNFGAAIFSAANQNAINDAQARIKAAEEIIATSNRRIRNATVAATRIGAEAATRGRGAAGGGGAPASRPADIGVDLTDPFAADYSEKRVMENWQQTVAAIRAGVEAGRQLDDVFGRVADSARRFTEDLSSGLGDAIVFGGNLGNVLVNSLKRAAAEAISSGLFKLLTGGTGGGIGGFVASIFGGARENGGPVMAGKAYLVGEKRPEIFVPNTSGRIIPNAGGAGIVVNQTIAPNFAGNAATREEVAMMGQLAKAQAIAGVKEAMSRRGGWR